MPFDAAEVARQIEQSKGGVLAEAQALEEALSLAVRVYREAGDTEWEQRVQDASARRWVASPLSPLQAMPGFGPALPDYCVTATDSSFVPPDKHRGALTHLINIGRVMIRYGERMAAEIDNTPNHYTDTMLEGEEIASGRIIGAKCALREIQELLACSRQYGSDLALVDGSLMQLVYILSKEAEVQELMRDYYSSVGAFHELGVPVVGYISRPASQMVMRAVRMLACEQPVPHEKRPQEECGCRSLWGLDDSDFFDWLLEPGQLSPIFEPVYSYLVGPNVDLFKDMVFAYLATDYEIVRLEFPVWVWQRGMLEGVVQTILHQCRLGKGYPNALLLAHQYAVLTHSDRESYYFLLERAGLMRRPTEKAHGKRLAGQAI